MNPNTDAQGSKSIQVQMKVFISQKLTGRQDNGLAEEDCSEPAKAKSKTGGRLNLWSKSHMGTQDMRNYHVKICGPYHNADVAVGENELDTPIRGH